MSTVSSAEGAYALVGGPVGEGRESRSPARTLMGVGRSQSTCELPEQRLSAEGRGKRPIEEKIEQTAQNFFVENENSITFS